MKLQLLLHPWTSSNTRSISITSERITLNFWVYLPVMNMTGLEMIQWKKNPWLKVVLKANKLIFYASDVNVVFWLFVFFLFVTLESFKELPANLWP